MSWYKVQSGRFQILPVESPNGVSASRKSNWTFYEDKRGKNLKVLLDSTSNLKFYQIGLSTMTHVFLCIKMVNNGINIQVIVICIFTQSSLKRLCHSLLPCYKYLQYFCFNNILTSNYVLFLSMLPPPPFPFW